MRYFVIVVILAITLTSLSMPFTSAQGDGPTNISLEAVIDAPVLMAGMQPGIDDELVFEPSIIYHDELFHAFYVTRTNNISPMTISYATSPDGIHWTPYEGNPIFTGDDSGFDAVAVRDPHVIVQNDGTWVMYYGGVRNPGQRGLTVGIGKATATMPEGPWERLEEPILSISDNPRAWDGSTISLEAIIVEDDIYRLYYSGSGSHNENHIGMATSNDGETWTPYNDPTTEEVSLRESDPVFYAGETGFVGRADIWKSDHGYEMIYSNGRVDGVANGLNYAFSQDGINWIQYKDNPLIPNTESEFYLSPKVIELDSALHVYFSLFLTDNQSQTTGQIWLAVLNIEWE